MSSFLDRLLGPWRRFGGGTGGGDAVPDAARFADEPVRRLVAGAAEGRVVLGLGAGGEPVTVALGGGEAAVAVVGGTDDEAVAILRPLLAQAVRQGARATILEPKRPAQRWAAGVPGVEHLAGPSEIHTVLVELAGTLRRPAGGDGARRRHVWSSTTPRSSPSWSCGGGAAARAAPPWRPPPSRRWTT